MDKLNTGARLRQLMQERGLKQVDIVRICAPYAQRFGISMGKSAISQYVSGKVLPAQRQLSVLGQALNVSEAWLMGYDVPRERSSSYSGNDLLNFPDVFPIRKKSFPLLGEIACGEPTYEEEEHETMVESTEGIDADFCLRARGDSMTGAQIDNGDIVFIKQMPMVDNGDIAAVVIENETTLKRVDYDPDRAELILWPENPAYRPQIYRREQLDTVRVLGRAVVIQKRIGRK